MNLITRVSMALLLCGLLHGPACAADAYDQGCSSYSAGNFTEAKSHFISAAKARPASWKAQYQLGNTYVQLKDTANAKKAYQKCITLHPPEDTKQQCLKAISYLSSNDLNNPPPAPVRAAAPVQLQQFNGSSRGGSGSSTAASSATPARASGSKTEADSGPKSADGEAQKARIMAEAEVQVNQIKAAAKQQLEDAGATSNQRYIYPDGSVKIGVSPEEEQQISREAEAKVTKIMQEARRRASAIQ